MAVSSPLSYLLPGNPVLEWQSLVHSHVWWPDSAAGGGEKPDQPITMQYDQQPLTVHYSSMSLNIKIKSGEFLIVYIASG